MLSALALMAVVSAWAHDTESSLDFTERPGATVPREVVFRDQTGAALTLASLLDRPTILVFEYFDCKDGCGLLLSNLAEAVSRLDEAPGDGYRLITVSFDPADTPALATEKRSLALSILGRPVVGNGWPFLIGDSDAVHAIADAVGFHYQRSGDGYAHPLGLVFLSPQGEVMRYIRGERFLPADLKLSLMEASTGTLGPTISRIARFCFRVDPAGRRLTFNALKVTGTVTLAAVACMFVILIAKSRKRKPEARRNE